MTATRDAFDLEVQVLRAGKVLGEAPLSLHACVEDAQFQSVLAGRLANDGCLPEFAVVPRGDEEGAFEGVPVAVLALAEVPSSAGASAGVTACNDAPARPLVRTYQKEVFAPQARALILSLRAENAIAAADEVEWQIVPRRKTGPPPRFGARVSRSPFPFRERTLTRGAPGALEVELVARARDDIRERVRAAGAVECAGLLVGFLERDAARRTALLRIIDSVPLEAGVDGASESHFGFAPASFGAARARVAARDDGAIPIGWYHSHPACAACPWNPACPSDTVFFSRSDVDVHAGAFSSAFMVALVAGKVADRRATDPGMRLYGWSAGCVAPLDFTVTGTGGDESPVHPRSDANPHHANPSHANPSHANPHHANPHHANPHHANPHHANPHHANPHHANPYEEH